MFNINKTRKSYAESKKGLNMAEDIRRGFYRIENRQGNMAIIAAGDVGFVHSRLSPRVRSFDRIIGSF